MNIEKASLYEKYRLPYAREAIDDLLGITGDVQVVVDIGAGTGQLARLFAGRCEKVYAIEPDTAMRQVAAIALADYPSVEIMAGCAEKIPLAHESIDLIVIGNALHRFKPEACDELRRILKKNGWIALFRYVFTHRAYMEMLFTKLADLSSVVNRIDEASYHTPAEALIGEGQIRKFSYSQSCLEDWGTFFGAACAGMEAPEPHEGDFAHFEAINRDVFDAFSMDGKIKIEYETQVTFGQPLVSWTESTVL